MLRVPLQLKVSHPIFNPGGGGYKAAQDVVEAPRNMKYPTARFSLPFGLDKCLPEFLVSSSQTICGAQNVKPRVDVALGDVCSSRRVGIKGEPQGEGKVSQAWKGEKGRLIQGVSFEENKTRVQVFLLAPTPPGSGVLGSLFTVCQHCFLLHLGSICCIFTPFKGSSKAPNVQTFSFLSVVNYKATRA